MTERRSNAPPPDADMRDDLNRRVIVIDDTRAIHDDFRKILCPSQPSGTALASLRAQFLGEAGAPARQSRTYHVDTALQGQEGLELVRRAVQREMPYAVAFVDMRMPPGWDGLTTIEHLWGVDPHLQIVICTAYSDYSWEQIQDRLGDTDQLLILRKPFDSAEVCQLASALTRHWELARQSRSRQVLLEQQITERTADLKQANQQLTDANAALKTALQEKERAEEKLRHDAFHDRLTDLPNRALLMERLDRCIERRKRQTDFQFAVLFIDLDNFKVVNDSLGHHCGDELLVTISRRIARCLRLLDTAARPGDDTTSRLGGDEFVILLDGISVTSDAMMIANRVLHAVTQPVDLDGHEIVVSASIGIATSQIDYEQPADVLRDADTAMYAAKELGRNRFVVFDHTMHAAAIKRLTLENDLRRAIDRDELRLQYQPIVSLSTGAIVAFEALLRWNHPDHGLIAPTEFIAIAEDSGSIVDIGGWVLLEAGRQLSAWREQSDRCRDLELSVNVSAKQLAQGDIVNQIKAWRDRIDVELDRLTIEITETAVVECGRSVDQIIREIKALGVKIHMDDFGTGYSSMSSLDELDFDALKIDRSFIKRLHQNRSAIASVQAMIQLAHLRDLRVVGEGVETYDAMVQLQALECDIAQGYFFSRPLDPDAALALIETEVRWDRDAA